MAGKFRFVYTDDKQRETAVYYRGEAIGTLHGGHESTGRWCFTLDCDRGPKRRQFRGRIRAAEALLVIHTTIKDWQRGGLTLRELIVLAWNTRPSGTGQSNLSSEVRKVHRAKRTAMAVKRPRRAPA